MSPQLTGLFVLLTTLGKVWITVFAKLSPGLYVQGNFGFTSISSNTIHTISDLSLYGNAASNNAASSVSLTGVLITGYESNINLFNLSQGVTTFCPWYSLCTLCKLIIAIAFNCICTGSNMCNSVT